MDITSEIEEKIEEYSKFVKQVLRPDLEKALHEKNLVENEISEYQALHFQLTALDRSSDRPIEKRVDLGYSKLYCKAIVTKLSMIFVHVGMGFHVEFTLEEAIAFINRRIDYLRRVLKTRNSNVEKIQRHIRESEMILDELSRPHF